MKGRGQGGVGYNWYMEGLTTNIGRKVERM
jgi:hypothetical protein